VVDIERFLLGIQFRNKIFALFTGKNSERDFKRGHHSPLTPKGEPLPRSSSNGKWELTRRYSVANKE